MRAAVFLDRDGTIIEDEGYPDDPHAVRLIPGAARALRELARAGLARIVITNQSGIGRGKFDVAAYHAVHAAMLELLAQQGAGIDAAYFCPHLPADECECRKPGTALHREATRALEIDLTRSWCVGDRPGDVEPARALGCGAILVLTGQGREHQRQMAAAQVMIAADLADAARLIVEQNAVVR